MMRSMSMRALIALLLSMSCAAADAIESRGEVPYVPTSMIVVEAMLKLGRVHSGDFIIDLGSGDGRIVITAAKKYGAQGFGVDIEPDLVFTANSAAKREGVADRAKFYQRNIFDTDFSQASVLTLYLFTEINLRLRDKVLALRPGTRVVSHDFNMGDWEPDEQITVDVPDKPYGPPVSKLFLWIVPAKAQGRWRWKQPVVGGDLPVELRLEQSFQRVTGKVLVSGRDALLVNPKLNGDLLSFSIVDDYMPRARFSGRVRGDKIEGTFTVEGRERSQPEQWAAERAVR